MRADLSLTDDDRVSAAFGAALGFAVGTLYGVVTIPSRALDVPMDTSGEFVSAAFQPISPTMHLFVPLAAVVAAYWYTRQVRDPDAPMGEGTPGDRTAATDGGESSEFDNLGYGDEDDPLSVHEG